MANLLCASPTSLGGGAGSSAMTGIKPYINLQRPTAQWLGI
jgi:hypothetical protein